MHNLLLERLHCPHCGQEAEMQIEMRFGDTSNLGQFRLGEACPWKIGMPVEAGGRPVEGDLDGEGYTECPACGGDFFVVVQVRGDRFSSVQIDLTRPGYMEEARTHPAAAEAPPAEPAWLRRGGIITENPSWVLDGPVRALLNELAQAGVDIFSSLKSDNFVLLIPRELTKQEKEWVDDKMQALARGVCGKLEFADSYPHGEKHRIKPNFFAMAHKALPFGVQIGDCVETGSGRVLSFDMKDILETLGERVLQSAWRCRDVECTGPASERLHQLSDSVEKVTGEELAQVAAGLLQTIEGDFLGFDESGPWVKVSAVDSTWFDLWTDETAVLEQVRRRFSQVTEIIE